MSATTNASGTVPAAGAKKAVVAGALGNFIEWFEFTIYGFFAADISANFFAGGADGDSLIATFAVFGVAFVVRPLGAMVFGHLGDKIGRRSTLSVSILGMSLSTFAIALLPTYDSVGILAPLLLLLARSVQGFCAGGEFGGATTFMVEYAPPNRGALYSSWQFFTQTLAAFVAALIGAGLSAAMDPDTLGAWGWRLPFLLALPLGLAGLYLRLRLDETPQFTQASSERTLEKSPLLETFRAHWKRLLTIVGIIVMGTTATYMVQAFFPAFLAAMVGIPQQLMFTAMLIGIAVLMALIPMWAALSDRIGRRLPFLVASPLGAAVLVVPIYLLLLHGTLLTIVLAYIMLALVLSPGMGCLAITMAEAFPTRVRYSGLSIAYSAAVSIFGGFTPLLLTTLVETTGDPLSPGYYLAGTGVLSLIAVLVLGETARRKA